ncbi:MAG: hypothetical protein ACTSPI_01445 [Candidatus Heimdallarchaeaceae archaeon]
MVEEISDIIEDDETLFKKMISNGELAKFQDTFHPFHYECRLIEIGVHPNYARQIAVKYEEVYSLVRKYIIKKHKENIKNDKKL